ncbi:MAG: hypothetical protein Q8834_02955, partial [Candidatus Phytoplasma australasiaticum]|nr:hypothetical protein [Candidatus Phytoplasma australasiaticum]
MTNNLQGWRVYIKSLIKFCVQFAHIWDVIFKKNGSSIEQMTAKLVATYTLHASSSFFFLFSRGVCCSYRNLT